MNSSRVIRGGTLYDGRGAPPFTGDLLIEGDSIAAVGSFDPPSHADMIDASGLAVAPGFIDVHSHSDLTLLVDPRAVSSVMQGVTTEIVGNCGHGCAPLLDRHLAPIAIYGPEIESFEELQSMEGYLTALAAACPAVNVLMLTPNGQLRLGTVGLAQRPATAQELTTMKGHLEQSLEEGSIGFSTGLEYAHVAQTVTTILSFLAHAINSR